LFDRLGRQGTLKIDNKDETVVEGTSQGILQMLNAGSNLYIGKYIVNTNIFFQSLTFLLNILDQYLFILKNGYFFTTFSLCI